MSGKKRLSVKWLAISDDRVTLHALRRRPNDQLAERTECGLNYVPGKVLDSAKRQKCPSCGYALSRNFR